MVALPTLVSLVETVPHRSSEGRNRPAIAASIQAEFATPWAYRLFELLERDAEAHWRNPTYLMAKLILNIVGGLFIGFTFFKAKHSIQGTQNKLFAIFMAMLLRYVTFFSLWNW